MFEDVAVENSFNTFLYFGELWASNTLSLSKSAGDAETCTGCSLASGLDVPADRSSNLKSKSYTGTF